MTAASRTAALLAAVVVLLLAGAVAAGPASAHTVSGGGATDYTSTITGVSPSAPGLTVSIIENSSRFELTNRTGQDVVVLGYYDEPYLRVLADGTVQQNALSPSVAINAVRRASQAVVPSTADPGAEPRWTPLDGRSTVRWHEHVLHEPEVTVPGVRANPGQAQTIADWTVALTVGGTPTTVSGELRYTPGPSPVLGWVVTGVAAAAVLGSLLLARWRAAVVGAAVLLVVVDVVQSVGVSLVRRGAAITLVGDFVKGNGIEAVAWVLGVAGTLLLRRGRYAGTYLVGVSAAVVLAVGGLGNVRAFSRSSAPFVFGMDAKRLVTALSIGLGAGLLLAVPVVLRRLDPLPPRGRAEPEDPAPVRPGGAARGPEPVLP